MEKDIGKIKKNDQTDIVVRIDDFGGRVGLTIREFVSSDKYTGFTKAGVRIPSSEFLRFREMVNSVSLDDMKDENATSKPASSSASKKPAKKPSNEDLDDY
ncbi:hypothetical protein COU57_06875 [Candidatus Pacearchaeota archaeon CG10_big_fil_rev_8_21_14_0_10_32_14]|nr:MAG: hypothetical protein COU57_06875 [Candidatus Pacearchaeota archaeon CG10_big_fil_rev_8_21_14_0_10_32_14]